MTKQKLTAERLHELLSYDPESGEFRWRMNRGPNRAGSEAGNINAVLGYRQIRIDYTLYFAHRLAWFYVHCEWPENELDHKNGVRCDNRIINLRSCTRLENLQNMAINAKNTSGFPGVSVHKKSGLWRASISVKNKYQHLGLFETAQEAGAAYKLAKQKFHAFQPTVRAAS